MDRREFLKVGAGCAIGNDATGAATGEPSTHPAPERTGLPAAAPLSIMVAAEDEHRRRLQNIGECNRGIRKCLRNHLIVDYLPGQVAYNLGEYPCRRPWDPD